MVEESKKGLLEQEKSLERKIRQNLEAVDAESTVAGVDRRIQRDEGLRLALQEVTDKLDKLKGESDEEN